MRRTLTIERDETRDAKDDRIPISISSETRVQRWFGVEILGHNADEIDLSRAQDNGLPLILDHTTRDHVGRVEDVGLRDGKLRGMMRFGRAARAQEIRQDVLDGIRTDVSVGYRIHDLKLVESDDNGDTYRATRWEPMETSLVAVPADIAVGVGRNADGLEYPVTILSATNGQEIRNVDPNTTAAPVAAPPVTTAAAALATVPATSYARNYAQEYADIENMVRSANLGRNEPLISDDERRGFIERGLTPDAVAKAIFTKMGATIREVPSAPRAILERPASDVREFSMGRALKALFSNDWTGAGYEREVSEAMRKQIGAGQGGVYFPMDQPLVPVGRTSLSAAGSTTGQKTVFTAPGSFIEYLANTAVVSSLGPLKLTGLTSNVALPRKSAKGSAAWYAELFGGSDATESNMQFDQVSLSPKTIASNESYSHQLFQQSVINIDEVMRSDILENIALEYDLRCFHGSGASNQISGLYTIAGVGSVAMGGAITFAKLVDMQASLEGSNAALASLAYVTTPEIKGKSLQKVRFTSTASPLWVGGIRGELVDYTAVASNQLSKVLGTGTNEHGIVFGAWSQAIQADWGAIRLTIDPYTKAGQDVVRIIGVALMDFNVRHPQSFCIGTGLTNT